MRTLHGLTAASPGADLGAEPFGIAPSLSIRPPDRHRAELTPR